MKRPASTSRPSALEHSQPWRSLWILIVSLLPLTVFPIQGQDIRRPEPDPGIPAVRPDPGAGASSDPAGLALRLDYPTLEVFENRAYIPLFFTVVGNYSGTNDLIIRARYVGGTATPGEDFDESQPVRILPAAAGGFFSLDWVALPLVQDEVNEGTETAAFELSLDGSTNAPVRLEVSILDDLNPGEVGFVSQRFQISEGSTNGYAQVRLWRTLNTRDAATVNYRLEGTPAALAVLGGATNRVATFQPGESQCFERIPLVNDTEVQGTRLITLTVESGSGGLTLMKGYESAVLTVADDETAGDASPLVIADASAEDGRRGVQLSTTVPRGYQARLEYSDNGIAGPWQLYWIFEGADTERMTFNSYDASAMRMFRILPPEPLDFTFPW